MSFKSKTYPIVKAIISLIAIALLGIVLQATVVSQPEKVSVWLSSFGPFLYVIYTLVQSAGIIFPPFPGSIFQVALIALIGPFKALVFSYFILTPLYCVNFLIAKKYGRPFVEKFLGKESMNKIDHYSKNAGIGTLILLKLFMGSLFDYLSYGIGLTNISFKTFFWINLIVGIPFMFVQYYVFSYSKDFTSSLILIGVLGSVFSGIYITLHHLKHKRMLTKIKTV